MNRFAEKQHRLPASGSVSVQPVGQRQMIREVLRGGPMVMRQSATPSAGASFAPTVFTPGVEHNHLPTGRWADVQKDSTAPSATELVCRFHSPDEVVLLARDYEMSDKPLARAHLNHFLRGGGVDLPVNLEDVLRRDVGVQAVLAREMRTSPLRGSVKIEQNHYDVQDFQYAFGAIDVMEYEVNPSAGLVHVWFKDRYEFHPVGYGYTSLPGDSRRDTNCVHAAAVELKSSGAADYWMVGDAVVPQSLFAGRKTLSWGTSERQEGDM